jgi:hypothetical protein
MNYSRIVVAAVAATVVFLIYGFFVDGMLIANDYIPYPQGVYRAGEAAKSHMPVGLAGIFVAILLFAIIYGKVYEHGGTGAGARLGVLFGIFMAGAFVAVNYATINISGKLALELAVSEPIEWTMVGVVVGLVYKPPVAATEEHP